MTIFEPAPSHFQFLRRNQTMSTNAVSSTRKQDFLSIIVGVITAVSGLIMLYIRFRNVEEESVLTLLAVCLIVSAAVLIGLAINYRQTRQVYYWWRNLPINQPAFAITAAIILLAGAIAVPWPVIENLQPAAVVESENALVDLVREMRRFFIGFVEPAVVGTLVTVGILMLAIVGGLLTKKMLAEGRR